MFDRLRGLSARLWAWLRSTGRDRDFNDELDAHIVMAIDDEIARGAPPDEARRRVLVQIGGIAAAREQHRDARGWPGIESLWRDTRDAAKLLARSPGFTAVAVLSLALGIGGNTAIFSILNSLVLRPLPVHEPDRLVQLNTGPQQTSWTYPLWEELRSRPDLFDGFAVWSSPGATSISLVDGPVFEPLAVSFVNGEFFETLGIRPQLGRLLGPADDTAGSQAVVLSDAFWRRRFGSDPSIIGRSLQLSGGTLPVTVVGVTPPEFFGLEVGRSFDMMMPLGSFSGSFARTSRTFWWLSILARLKPDQTTTAATSALQTLQPALREATLPADLPPNDLDAYLSTPLTSTPATTGLSAVREEYQRPLTTVMVAVALVLIIACANIANLLLARADARRHEISVRLALGASRGRLVRQLLVESLLLAASGAALGLLVASWGSQLLVRQLTTPLSPVDLALPLDWRVLGFAAATAAITVILFGIAPALRATRVAPRAALVEKGRSAVGPSNSRLAHGLVVAQIALSIVLAVGATLLVRSFAALSIFDLGFDPKSVLELSVRPNPTRATNFNTVSLDAVIDAIRAVPGVESAAFSDFSPPMSGGWEASTLENPPGLSLSGSERQSFVRNVGTDWFTTMGMRFVLGRDFTSANVSNASNVVIVNETLARRFFPGRNPIGETLRAVGSPAQPAPPLTIVGVVNDAIYNSVREGAPPTLYRFRPAASSLLVKVGHGDVDAIARSVTDAIAQAAPDLLVISPRPLNEHVRATVARERLVSMLSGFFAVLALLLASVGVYGVLAYAVGRRRSEIAVRRALGATDASIVRLVLGRSGWLIVCGTAIGVLGSYWLTGFLQPLLYGLDAGDPATLTGVVAMMAIVGLLAGWLPTRRARRIDPAAVLRES